MDALAQIKALLTERQDHERAIVGIDHQLAEIRRVLGIDATPEKPINGRRVSSRTWTGEESGTQKAVLRALAEREPQTVKQLEAATHSTTVAALLPHMLARGEVFRRRAYRSESIANRTFVYARSTAALDRTVEGEGEAGDDAASGIPGDVKAADGNLSDTAISQTKFDCRAM